MPFNRHALRIRLEAVMAVDTLDGAGPRLWRMRAFRHVAQYLRITVIERLVNVLTRARGVILNVPMADRERRLSPGVWDDQHAQIRERYVG